MIHEANNNTFFSKKKEAVNVLNEVFISIEKDILKLMMQWNKDDIAFVKSLINYSYSKKYNHWTIGLGNDNFNKIKSYFKGRINIVDNLDEISIKQAASEINKNEVHIVEYNKGRIKIIVKYNEEFITLIKSLPFANWDSVNKWWTVAKSEKVLKDIENYCNTHNMRMVFFNQSKKTLKGRLLKEHIINYRECPEEYLTKLRLLRYSKSTINSYKSHFEEFINYYNSKKIVEISEPEIIEFTRYLVVERGVSASYQNLSINAIKFYYEVVLGEKRKFYHLTRPKKEKALPIVLSKEEINKMISLTENIKHKCILIIMYSGGLRVSEVINLKIKDIDSKRGLITIRQSKGKKDRNTLLSAKSLFTLRQYYRIFAPKIYLFEGARGDKYTSSSLQKVVKQAASRAGITKHVTPHTLRHSFATHLLEQGVNLRYIQNILGHESSKTTEIYTHVSSTGIKNIINPLDDMDF